MALGWRWTSIRSVIPARRSWTVHGIVEPVTGGPYLDGDANFPYKIDHEDLCFRLFTEHGFEWGGDWEDRKDYRNFEIPTGLIEEWYPSNQ